MKLFFEPRTVALVGASGNPARPGYHLFQNLKISFGDSFYPVNPRAGRIDGVLCHRSVLDIPAEIDLAVIFVPAREVPRVLEECARKGIRRATIESAGFAEAGPAGAVLQERCLAAGFSSVPARVGSPSSCSRPAGRTSARVPPALTPQPSPRTTACSTGPFVRQV